MTPTDEGRLGYEPRDAQPRPILVAVGIIALLCIFGLVAAWLTLRSFESRAVSGHDEVSPLFEREVPEQAPLLVDEPAWAADYLRAQRRHLSSYGWVDEPLGVVHIPIEEAMKQQIELREEERR